MAVTTKIDVQACDNELIIIASTTQGSSVLCHLKSGYDAPVSYIFNPGNILPPGNYDLTFVGINWGGKGEFSIFVDGTRYFGSNPAKGVVFTKTIPMVI